jgi:hypothetical protein
MHTIIDTEDPSARSISINISAGRKYVLLQLNDHDDGDQVRISLSSEHVKILKEELDRYASQIDIDQPAMKETPHELYQAFFASIFDEKHGIAMVEDLLKLHNETQTHS